MKINTWRTRCEYDMKRWRERDGYSRIKDGQDTLGLKVENHVFEREKEDTKTKTGIWNREDLKMK